MISLRRGALAAASLVALLAAPVAANAHRQWMLPSSTVLSGNDPWITVDAAVSNDLFYFDHVPMRLEGVAVIAPDGVRLLSSNFPGSPDPSIYPLAISGRSAAGSGWRKLDRVMPAGAKICRST